LVLVVMAVLMRTEVILVAGAIGSVLCIEAVARRQLWPALVGGTAMGGAVLGIAIERVWRSSIVGEAELISGPAGRVMATTDTWVAGRLESFRTTILWPGEPPRGAMLAAAVLLLLVGGVATLGSDTVRRFGPALMGASSLVLVAVAVGEHQALVPGLAITTALIPLALVTGFGRASLAVDERRLVAIAALAGAAIWLTQYAEGGGVEWGGRYFAVLLPLAVPVAVRVLASVSEGMDWRRVFCGAIVIHVGLMSIVAARTVTVRSAGADAVLAKIQEVAPPVRLASSPDDLRPVVITGDFALPRIDWRRYEEKRWVFLHRRTGVRRLAHPVACPACRRLPPPVPSWCVAPGSTTSRTSTSTCPVTG
jgi:hypothetical protein